mgnify:FL=1
MKYIAKTRITFVSALFLVLIFGFASHSNAYTADEIVDYINTYLSGASDAEIAAVASSYGVSASDISNAYQEVRGVVVSARAEEAFSQVVTVTLNDTDYYTTAGESSNVYTAPPDEGTNNPIGTFNANTGVFTDESGSTVDITTLSNVTGSLTNAGGTVTTVISGQSWDAVVSDTAAGYTYLSCVAGGADATGCLAAYSSGNVVTTTLTPLAGRACTAGTPETVRCSDHVGTYGIPPTYVYGNATYSINSCGILTDVDVSECSAVLVPRITSFTASPKGFSAGGGSVTLSWATVNADSCTLTSDGGLNLTGDPRSITSYPIPNRVTRTSTYTLTCSGPGGTTTR